MVRKSEVNAKLYFIIRIVEMCLFRVIDEALNRLECDGCGSGGGDLQFLLTPHHTQLKRKRTKKKNHERRRRQQQQ